MRKLLAGCIEVTGVIVAVAAAFTISAATGMFVVGVLIVGAGVVVERG